MDIVKNLLVIALFALSFGCNSNNSSNKKLDSTQVINPKTLDTIKEVNKSTVVNDFDIPDSIDYKTKLSFTGEVQLSQFGEPGEEYSKNEKLPNHAYILIVNSPKTFYYNDDLDSLTYSFYENYKEFQLVSADSVINANLNKFVGKKVILEGTIFQGMTKHYIRDLAIDISKIRNNK